MKEKINVIIFKKIISHQDITLDGVGSLKSVRKAAQADEKTSSVKAPQYRVEFSTTQDSQKLTNLIASELSLTPEEAYKEYETWLKANKKVINDVLIITINGVGSILYKKDKSVNFNADPKILAILSPLPDIAPAKEKIAEEGSETEAVVVEPVVVEQSVEPVVVEQSVEPIIESVVEVKEEPIKEENKPEPVAQKEDTEMVKNNKNGAKSAPKAAPKGAQKATEEVVNEVKSEETEPKEEKKSKLFPIILILIIGCAIFYGVFRNVANKKAAVVEKPVVVEQPVVIEQPVVDTLPSEPEVITRLNDGNFYIIAGVFINEDYAKETTAKLIKKGYKDTFYEFLPHLNKYAVAMESFKDERTAHDRINTLYYEIAIEKSNDMMWVYNVAMSK